MADDAAPVNSQEDMILSVDVVREVIMQLQVDKQLKSLVALSLSCKTLCAYALDALWFSVSSLVPLLQCFPSDVWGQDEAGEWVSCCVAWPAQNV